MSPIHLVGGPMFAIMSVVSFLCKWFIALKTFCGACAMEEFGEHGLP
jgi:hypothetical protein